MNKYKIYIDVGLHILFRIIGSRWDTRVVSKLYNKNWIRNSAEETLLNYKVVKNGSYW